MNASEEVIIALTDIEEAKRAAAPFCDFGSILGARDEMEEINRELSECMNRISRRARKLRERIRRWNANQREVDMLK